MKSLEQRREESLLEWPVWLLQTNDGIKEDEGRVSWRTDRVFLDWEEGVKYAEKRSYRYGEKDKDWRVYGVPCDGELKNRI